MGSEARYRLRGKAFAVRHWGRGGEIPVIALHGWQDNCASFDFLAPRLTGCHVAAMDMAGHGLSDHRSADSAYNIWQDVGDVLDLADALGWERFNLLGHSRGAIVAALLAGCFPEKVSGLILLDALMPEPVDPDRAPQQLAEALQDRRRHGERQPRVYHTRDEALAARLRGPLQLSRRAAEAIADRGLEETAAGLRWRTDPRLRSASEVKLSEAHCRAFVRRIDCPVLLLEAGHRKPEWHQRLVAENARVQRRVLEAPHHLHMDGDVSAVAGAIGAFLVQAPENGSGGRDQ